MNQEPKHIRGFVEAYHLNNRLHVLSTHHPHVVTWCINKGYIWPFIDDDVETSGICLTELGKLWLANTQPETSALENEQSLSGTITSIRNLVTKNNDVMAVIELDCNGVTHTCTLFPRTWKRYGYILSIGVHVTIRGEWYDKSADETTFNCHELDVHPERTDASEAGQPDSEYTVETEVYDDEHPEQTTSVLRAPDGHEVATKASRNAAIYMRDILNTETARLRATIADKDARIAELEGENRAFAQTIMDSATGFIELFDVIGGAIDDLPNADSLKAKVNALKKQMDALK